LVVNQGRFSSLMVDLSKDSQEQMVKAYVSRVALQLGMPPLREEAPRTTTYPENALTQPIDMTGLRLGLLIVIPYTHQTYKPGDQKVVRLIAEQLSIVLRLYQSHAQREGAPVPTN
jgi:hypothetical protein